MLANLLELILHVSCCDRHAVTDLHFCDVQQHWVFFFSFFYVIFFFFLHLGFRGVASLSRLFTFLVLILSWFLIDWQISWPSMWRLVFKLYSVTDGRVSPAATWSPSHLSSPFQLLVSVIKKTPFHLAFYFWTLTNSCTDFHGCLYNLRD